VQVLRRPADKFRRHGLRRVLANYWPPLQHLPRRSWQDGIWPREERTPESALPPRLRETTTH